MIVCSCNILSDRRIRTVLDTDLQARPRTAGQLYKCMGCKPECGRCLPTIQRIMTDHAGAACKVGCPACPAHAVAAASNDESAPMLVAAE